VFQIKVADLTLEDFFIDLPAKISQVRRQLFSYNETFWNFGPEGWRII